MSQIDAPSQSTFLAAAPASGSGLALGQLVRSLTGRDKGRYYLVLAREQGGFVLLTDGRERPLAKPKRKNARHLQATHQVAADLGRKAEDHSLTNEDVRGALLNMIGKRPYRE